MTKFQHMTEGHINRVPQTMDDACEALIIAHWVTDMLRSVFKNEDDRAIYAHVHKRDADENPEGHNFVELFVQTHQLREYLPPIPEGHFRFEIYRDLSRPAVWYGNELPRALLHLVILDTEQAVIGNWNKFFSLGALV